MEGEWLFKVVRFTLSGNLQGNRQQWKFFKNTNFDYFVQIYKILHPVMQDWSTLRWSDRIFGTEIRHKRCTFFFFSNFDLFGKVLENCLMLTFPKTNRSCVAFSYSQSLYFMLVINFVPDGIKKCIRNCKNMIKK